MSVDKPDEAGQSGQHSDHAAAVSEAGKPVVHFGSSLLGLALVALFTVGVVGAWNLAGSARAFPLTLSIVGLVVSVASLIYELVRMRSPQVRTDDDPRQVLRAGAGFIAAMFVFSLLGLILGSLVVVGLVVGFERRSWKAGLITGVATAGVIWAIHHFAQVPIPGLLFS